MPPQPARTGLLLVATADLVAGVHERRGQNEEAANYRSLSVSRKPTEATLASRRDLAGNRPLPEPFDLYADSIQAGSHPR
jgi:hypothetical protein